MSKYIPNAFQIPNDIVDEIMAKLSGNAIKCYLLIVRKTLGWNKQLDFIPASQFHDLTGIKKADTLTAAIKELEIFSLIIAQRERGKVTGYRLNLGHDIGQKVEQVHPLNGVTSTPTGQSATGENQQQTIPQNQVHPLKGYTRFKGILLPHSYIFLYPLFGYTLNSGTPDNWGQVHPLNGVTSTPEKRVPSKPNTKPINTKPNLLSESEDSDVKPPVPTKPKKSPSDTKARINLFTEFYAAYPKKEAKANAEKAFLKIDFKKHPFEKIMDALEVVKKSGKWDDRKFIPQPATWLNGQRWEDEIEIIQQLPANPNSQPARPYSADELQAFKPVVIHEPDTTPNPAARAESARIAAELAKTLSAMEE